MNDIGFISSNDLAVVRAVHPTFEERWYRDFRSGQQLSHYTGQAPSIIEYGEIWLRDVTLMNDYSEVLYGLQAHLQQLKSASAAPIRNMFSSSDGFDQLLKNVEAVLNGNVAQHIYCCCFSVHEPQPTTECEFGRLSMWRAYAPENGAALLFKPGAVLARAYAAGGYLLPVSYQRSHEFAPVFGAWADYFSKSFIKSTDSELLVSLTRVLHARSATIKHPAFAEEREWRLMIHPDELRMNVSLDFLKPISVTVSGVPQIVFKLDLLRGNHASSNGVPLSQIMLGPTSVENKRAMRTAFSHLLDQSYQNEQARVPIIATQIPLRSKS